MIQNPILRGFRPDPAILRLRDDYYIVTSTFEWFPGLEIHHSKDLKHWRLLGHALTRKSQLDLARTAPSHGIWAPCLTYNEQESFQQMAGLVCLYDDINHYYLRIYHSDSLKSRCLGLMSADNGVRSEHLNSRAAIPEKGRFYLRVVVHERDMTFHHSLNGADWLLIRPVLDASRLSDEYRANGQFTGAFVGITAQDFYLRQSHADFDYFEYLEMHNRPSR